MSKPPITAIVSAIVSALALVTGMAALAQDLPASPPAPETPPPARMVQPGGMRHVMPPLTREAALAGAARGFAMIDADHDGVVTRAEFDAWRQRRVSMMAERRGRAGGDGPPPPPAPPGAGAPPPPEGGGWRGGRGFAVGSALMGPRWFDTADADRDGRVTAAEAQTAAAAAFDRMDTDHDGTLSPDERRAGMMAMRDGMR